MIDWIVSQATAIVNLALIEIIPQRPNRCKSSFNSINRPQFGCIMHRLRPHGTLMCGIRLRTMFSALQLTMIAHRVNWILHQRTDILAQCTCMGIILKMKRIAQRCNRQVCGGCRDTTGYISMLIMLLYITKMYKDMNKFTNQNLLLKGVLTLTLLFPSQGILCYKNGCFLIAFVDIGLIYK